VRAYHPVNQASRLMRGALSAPERSPDVCATRLPMIAVALPPSGRTPCRRASRRTTGENVTARQVLIVDTTFTTTRSDRLRVPGRNALLDHSRASRGAIPAEASSRRRVTSFFGSFERTARRMSLAPGVRRPTRFHVPSAFPNSSRSCLDRAFSCAEFARCRSSFGLPDLEAARPVAVSANPTSRPL